MHQPGGRDAGQRPARLWIMGLAVAAAALGVAQALRAAGAPDPGGARAPAPGWGERAVRAALLGLADAWERGWALLNPDPWAVLMRTGDRLGFPEADARRPLGARTAYLLAFHHAQDAGDVGRMLAATERLAALGERELADHLRGAVWAVDPRPLPP